MSVATATNYLQVAGSSALVIEGEMPAVQGQTDVVIMSVSLLSGWHSSRGECRGFNEFGNLSDKLRSECDRKMTVQVQNQ